MPLFVFVSGYLSKDIEKIQRKAFQRFLLPYLVWNSFYFILITLYQRKLQFSFLYPWFANWYFLSLFTMCLLLPIVIKIKWNIFTIFFMSLVVGFFSEFSSLFSFSRTVCFFGFFLLGYYSDINILERIRYNKKLIIILSIILMVIIYVYCVSGIVEKKVLASSLTKSASYKSIGTNLINGFIIRAATIPVSILLGIFVLASIPQNKNILTKFGRNSIVILIFHKYFIMVFEKIVELLNINIHTISGIILLIIVSIGITVFLSISVFNKIYSKTMELIQKIIMKENV
jgi:fucose 4-O-acetylase-like acetyltransferase